MSIFFSPAKALSDIVSVQSASGNRNDGQYGKNGRYVLVSEGGRAVIDELFHCFEL